jgi:pentatricopeptide repeat protein
MANEDPYEPIRLFSTPHEWAAGLVVAALQAEGIKATMAGESTAEFRAGVPGWVEVYVAEGDLEKAEEILDRVQEENSHIDWSQVDVGEPEDE